MAGSKLPGLDLRDKMVMVKILLVSYWEALEVLLRQFLPILLLAYLAL